MGPVSIDHGDFQDLQDFGIGIREAFLIGILVPVRPHDLIAARPIKKREGHDAPSQLDLGKIRFDRFRERGGHRRSLIDLSIVIVEVNQPVNTVDPGVPAVIAQLIPDEQGDQQTGGDTQGKSPDLDGGVKLLLSQLAKSDLPIIFKHSIMVYVERMRIPPGYTALHIFPPDKEKTTLKMNSCTPAPPCLHSFAFPYF